MSYLPFEVIRAVIETDVPLPRTPYDVLLALAQFAHDDGTEARPSQALIARRARIASTHTVNDALKWLEQAGYITATSQRGGGYARDCTVTYTIHLERLVSSARIAEHQGQSPARIAEHRQVSSAIQSPMLCNLVPDALQFRSQSSARIADEILSEKQGENYNKETQAASFVQSHDAEPEPEAGDEDLPCADGQAVLDALAIAAGEEGAHRAWHQHVQTFLDSHATPNEIVIGYMLMRQRFAETERKPGVPMLAKHWDEWQSKARSEIAKRRRQREVKAAEERERAWWEQQRQEHEAAAAAEREREGAIRAAMTPEQREAADEATRLEEEERERRSTEHRKQAMARARAYLNEARRKADAEEEQHKAARRQVAS